MYRLAALSALFALGHKLDALKKGVHDDSFPFVLQ